MGLQNHSLAGFVGFSFKTTLRGSGSYYLWVAGLMLGMLIGFFAYLYQLNHGLKVTGMNDYVSWGLYISNFTFLVGLAAAAVMVVLPAYVFKDVDFSKAVLMGEGVAVAALIMCLCFVVVDMGQPFRLWHMIPGIGFFNWPDSLLTWDTIVLNGYLLLNCLIPFYILFSKYRSLKPQKKYYLPFVYLSMAWAIGIHLTTAFLYAGLPARPFWNTGLLGPRFLASAFAAGPAFIILTLAVIKSKLSYPIKDETVRKLSLVMTVAAQINLVMLGSEIFKEFYQQTEHGLSAKYLFFGIGDHTGLVPWIWSALFINIACTMILTIHSFRERKKILYSSCFLLFVSIWIEKGMGLIVPGFIPSPLGEIVEYSPSLIEVLVTGGIWCLGLFILTILVRVAVAVERISESR